MAEIIRFFGINAASQQELDDRVENLVLYSKLLALVRQHGIIAVVEAFEQIGGNVMTSDEK